MKFAKELEANLVPEWKEKYLNYKLGKKKLKAVARAMRNADKSPGPYKPWSNTPGSNSLRGAPVYSYLNRTETRENPTGDRRESQGSLIPARSRNESKDGDGDRTPRAKAQPIPANERSPLRQKGSAPHPEGRGLTRYGSILGSPPQDEDPDTLELQKQASLLELPDPALDPGAPKGDSLDIKAGDEHPAVMNTSKDRRSSSFVLPSPAQAAHRKSDSRESDTGALQNPKYRSIFQPKRVNTMPGDARPFAKRVFSLSGAPSPKAPRHTNTDIALEAYREIDFRQADFFVFLDKEMEKIEDFYKAKEDQATERLKALRTQLHVMRNHRLDEIVEAERSKKRHPANDNSANDGLIADNESGLIVNGTKGRRISSAPWLPSVDNAVGRIDHALDKVRGSHIGKTSRAMEHLGTPHLAPQFPPDRGPMDQRDYTRRQTTKEVPYRAAKRKLKIALAEFYRGLELLKSYAILNRTAFRKINKKFDKAVNARPSGRYMEKVNEAYFVKSEVLDGHIQAVEDLYARYFERGNHKLAVGKLRAKATEGDYTGSVWRQGVMATAGLVFGIEGLVYGAEQLFDADPTISVHASYLLQIYAGYFLMLLLVCMFVVDTIAFSMAKVNYQFVFEFDSRHMLNWRQLSEMPALFLLLLGLVMWLNFQQVGGMTMYIYWPVVLIGASVGALFLPAPFFYHRARRWFLYSNWRLLLAGLYPVEFRDFFLGDMFCSQTYAMGNIELFFCLYARGWNGPAQCNSSHSRLLGFFTCLPGIWRLLQCLRRYYDTRNVFPHLVNGGKYTFTILGAMSLSLFRVSRTTEMLGFFIFCATVNSIYCSIWDVIMDWSLGVPAAKYPFLRHTLAYKNIWWYYTALVLDPILRFNWIFYAIYANDVQHSSVISFAVAFSEVIRRGIWTLFRVENEHCTNVGRFRASRDVPLPYEVETDSSQSLLGRQSEEEPEEEAVAVTDARAGRSRQGKLEQPNSPYGFPDAQREPQSDRMSRQSTHTTAVDLERNVTAPTPGSASVRRRHGSIATDSPITRTLRNVGSTMLSAHAQDYERKRKPSFVKPNASEDSDDDDDDDGSSDSDSDPPPAHLNRTPRSQRESDRSYAGHERSTQESRDLEEALSRAGRGDQS